MKKKSILNSIKGLSKGKKIGLGLALVVGIGFLATPSDTSAKDSASSNGSTVSDSANKDNKDSKPEAAPKEEKADDTKNVPSEHKLALKKAKSYSTTMSMSKQGLYEQLTSEYGEKFKPDAAQYAIDNLKVDYKENALKKAKSYRETMSMSNDAIYDQLVSEYGEKFTKEEAQYAVDNLK